MVSSCAARARFSRFIAVAALMLSAVVPALAGTSQPASTAPPQPQASPVSTPSVKPSPSESPGPPREGWQISFDAMSSFTDQATNGAGTTPPEAAAFAAGAALSPMTPYDTLSSAPTTPGVAGVAQFLFGESYTGKRLQGSVNTGLQYLNGSVTNIAYWTESLMPTVNPHIGSQALPYSIVFPTHAGQDDARTIRGSILSASVGATDSQWLLKGGWLDLAQSDRFVFVQPPLTNVTPAITVQTAETLGNGPPTIDGWPSPAPGLPVDGVDLTLHHGSATAELTSAALPSLPGTSARVSIGSIVLDRGAGTRFSGELLHLVTGGGILSTTTLFGANAKLNPGPQGPLPTSDLGGQTETIAGIRGAFHATRALNATLEIGRAWYNADHVLEPGTQKPGGYYHAALSRSIGMATASAEAFRFEPRYGSAILPYGAPENIWSVAWSWPGIWLKSTYQINDNSAAGSNRQGYKLRYAIDHGPLEVHASFSAFHQIETSSLSNANQVGFVEGFFLPQQPGFATMARQKQYGAWIAWHPPSGDITLDYVDNMMHRDFAPTQPQDAVSYDAPQTVLSYARALNKTATVAVGAGRYAMRGSFAQGAITNVDFVQDIVFAGGQFAESKQAMILVQLRHSSFFGSPSISGGPSPNYSGSFAIIEQRFHV